jgi:ABC-type methionine transport system ATPase subunit
VDHIKNTPFGTLLMDVKGTGEEREGALSFLRAKNVHAEVLN